MTEKMDLFSYSGEVCGPSNVKAKKEVVIEEIVINEELPIATDRVLYNMLPVDLQEKINGKTRSKWFGIIKTQVNKLWSVNGDPLEDQWVVYNIKDVTSVERALPVLLLYLYSGITAERNTLIIGSGQFEHPIDFVSSNGHSLDYDKIKSIITKITGEGNPSLEEKAMSIFIDLLEDRSNDKGYTLILPEVVAGSYQQLYKEWGPYNFLNEHIKVKDLVSGNIIHVNSSSVQEYIINNSSSYEQLYRSEDFDLIVRDMLNYHID